MNHDTQHRIIAATEAARTFARVPNILARTPVYIAGPMSGLPELNYPAFHAAGDELRNHNINSRNPARSAPPNDAPTWADWMRLALRQLIDCRSVLLLPGWRESRGAIIEARLALDLGMLVINGETGAQLNDGHNIKLPPAHAISFKDAHQPEMAKPDPAIEALEAIERDHARLRDGWNAVITALHQTNPNLFANPAQTAVEAAVSAIWNSAAANKCCKQTVEHYREKLTKQGAPA